MNVVFADNDESNDLSVADVNCDDPNNDVDDVEEEENALDWIVVFIEFKAKPRDPAANAKPVTERDARARIAMVMKIDRIHAKIS